MKKTITLETLKVKYSQLPIKCNLAGEDALAAVKKTAIGTIG